MVEGGQSGGVWLALLETYREVETLFEKAE